MIFELKFNAGDCNDAFRGIKTVWLEDRDIKQGAPKHYFLLGGKYQVYSFHYKSHEGSSELQKFSTFAFANTKKKVDDQWVDIDQSEVPEVMATLRQSVCHTNELGH